MKAIVLLSGGLDSTVTLAIALKSGRQCLAVSFDYGQRHRIELEYARQVAAHFRVEHKVIKLDPTIFSGSSLTSAEPVPAHRTVEEIAVGGIPSTYVPARNTLFLAYATAFAEVYGADEIYIGMNRDDRQGYPDCRPAYIDAFQKLLHVATKQATTAKGPTLVTPLTDMTKKEIVEEGIRLQAPLSITWSCYAPTMRTTACGVCDACILRDAAFRR
jgi:7-cyano-7-deazaguanine synthase